MPLAILNGQSRLAIWIISMLIRLIQAKDRGFMLIGATSFAGSDGENLYVVKLDPLGNIKWKKTIDGPTYNEGSSIIQTIDGGYAVGGYKESLTQNTHSDRSVMISMW